MNKKRQVSNNNKNSSLNESISNYLYKINENENCSNNISRDNSYNIKNYHLNGKNKLKLKIPFNITNNNYNMNKSSVMINLSTNIIDDNLNLEKLKVQQKLAEYRKLIDKKINELKSNKKGNLNQKKKKTKSTYESDKIIARDSSPKNFELHKKTNICSNSDNEGKTKRKITNISKTNYKYLDKEYFKNIHDINILVPKKINVYNNNNNNNNNNNINKKIVTKNRVNIISKNIDVKDNFNLIDNETTNKNNNNSNDIHEQITSKGNDEKKENKK